MIDGITFVDALCRTGLPCIKQEGAIYYADDLVAEMDRVGVDGALVHHVHAQEVSPAEGNEAVLREGAGTSRLLPVWVGLPPATGELEPPERWCRNLDRSGVRAVTFFPGEGWDTHGYRLVPRNVGGLFECLNADHVPVILNFGASNVSVSELADLAERYPGIPFIVARFPPTVMRNLLPLLLHAPNVYLETSLFQVNGGIEWACNALGPERLVFGSNMPTSSLGAAVAPVLYADIPRESKQLIASGNLMRLLRMDEGARPVGTGREMPQLPYRIIDGHGHVGPWGPSWIEEHDADAIVRRLDRLNVEFLCATSAWSLAGDNRSGNDRLAAEATRHSGRIIPYATFNPNDTAPRAELERCFDELGMRLVKIHPGFHRCALGSRKWAPVWQLAEERKTIVLIHTVGTTEDCDAAVRIASDHPHLRLLLAHAGNGFDNADHYLAAAATCPNIFLELTFSACLDGIIEHLVATAPQRIVYGSDMAWRAPESQYGWAAWARIGEEHRQWLLRDTMLGLLRYAGALPS